MPPDLLDQQLREWGRATMGRHAANEDGPPSVNAHPIARAREFASGKKKKEFVPVGRDGRERRRFLAANAGVDRMTIIKPWAVDPIRCVDSSRGGGSASVDLGVPEELKWIDRMMLDLYRQNPLRGVCLRLEYCGFGTQAEKAVQAARAEGCDLTLRQYRSEVKLAREWMRGRVAA